MNKKIKTKIISYILNYKNFADIVFRLIQNFKFIPARELNIIYNDLYNDIQLSREDKNTIYILEEKIFLLHWKIKELIRI